MMNNRLKRIIAAGIIFAVVMLLKTDIAWLKPVLFLAGYFIVGWDVLLRAVKKLTGAKLLDEHFLISVATIGAFAIGHYPEAVAVMLFYQVGELFQSYAVNKSRKSIAQLMDIRPDYANVMLGGSIVKTDPNKVNIGEIIVVASGEKIPLDGVVEEGSSALNMAALTGEASPVEVAEGSEVFSGSVNLHGVINIKVTKSFENSTVSKILDLVENAAAKKSNSERFITRFAVVYTPIVVGLAALLAIVPPLLIQNALFTDWLYRALTFLVVSCPCALVISVPLSFFGGIGGASKSGILVKGGNYLEALAKVDTVVFDKTGTLTKGVFKVQEICAKSISEEELLKLTAYAEYYSTHPISLSLKQAYGKEIDQSKIKNVKETAGFGVHAVVDGVEVFAGNAKLMEQNGIKFDAKETGGTAVYVTANGKYAGYILIADEVKNDARVAIELLKANGIKQTVMLTGDSKGAAEKVASYLGIDKIYSRLLPGDKVGIVEDYIKQQADNSKLAFVGDGINDAPVLARADIGIAMGGLGSDAAIEAADIVIMTDEPSKIVTAIKISKKTLRVARENIAFALIIKIGVLILSAFGLATMWEATFADVGVTVIAVLNSFRTLETDTL